MTQPPMLRETDLETGTALPRAARVRGQRLEITSADLNMYRVITGRAPSREERRHALTWGENDPLRAEIAAAAAVSATLPMHALRPWHPAALSMRLRDLWFNGITVRGLRLNTCVRRLYGALRHGRLRMRRGRNDLPGRTAQT